MVRILTYRGDDAFLVATYEDDPKVKEIRWLCGMHENDGYNYNTYFRLLHTEQSNGMPKTVLIHKKSNGFVLNMLQVFDIILAGRNTSDCHFSPPSHFFFVQKQLKYFLQKIRLRMS